MRDIVFQDHVTLNVTILIFGSKSISDASISRKNPVQSPYNTIQYNTTVFLERLTKNKSYSKTLYSVIYVQTLVFQP